MNAKPTAIISVTSPPDENDSTKMNVAMATNIAPPIAKNGTLSHRTEGRARRFGFGVAPLLLASYGFKRNSSNMRLSVDERHVSPGWKSWLSVGRDTQALLKVHGVVIPPLRDSPRMKADGCHRTVVVMADNYDRNCAIDFAQGCPHSLEPFCRAVNDDVVDRIFTVKWINNWD
jgi:hypothetical protein